MSMLNVRSIAFLNTFHRFATHMRHDRRRDEVYFEDCWSVVRIAKRTPTVAQPHRGDRYDKQIGTLHPCAVMQPSLTSCTAFCALPLVRPIRQLSLPESKNHMRHISIPERSARSALRDSA